MLSFLDVLSLLQEHISYFTECIYIVHHSVTHKSANQWEITEKNLNGESFHSMQNAKEKKMSEDIPDETDGLIGVQAD